MWEPETILKKKDCDCKTNNNNNNIIYCLVKENIFAKITICKPFVVMLCFLGAVVTRDLSCKLGNCMYKKKKKKRFLICLHFFLLFQFAVYSGVSSAGTN